MPVSVVVLLVLGFIVVLAMVGSHWPPGAPFSIQPLNTLLPVKRKPTDDT